MHRGSPLAKARGSRANLVMALQLRPTCEHCNRALPPDSLEAMICSFECTFCRTCVERILLDVCPNCGGNFCARPIRPKTARKAGLSVATRPATTTITHHPVDVAAHAAFAAPVRAIAPAAR